EARGQVVRDVVEGRITLAEARARWAVLLREGPEYETVARWLDRDTTEEERLNQWILGWARVILKGRPEKAAVLRALEEQVRAGCGQVPAAALPLPRPPRQ